MSNISLLISTCDKFSDLWDTHIRLLKENWIGDLWKIYMVTDRPTNKSFETVNIIVADEGMDFPMRIKYALDYIETEYVLLTLDDYYLVNKTDAENLNYLADRAENENIDYLLLYNRRKVNPKKYQPIEKLFSIDLDKKYAVNLYPAIWQKEFLKNSVKSNMNPWMYEPTLTKYAKKANANCQFSHSGTYDILDVVRKGKILHKAKRFFKKNNIDLGSRPTISYLTEFKLASIERFNWYAPKSIKKIAKKLAVACGMKFYSED